MKTMIRNTKRHRGLMGASAVAIAASLMLAGGAMAQTATSTIRGNVTDQGQAEAGAQIVARDTATGYVSRSTANASGNYVLSGLRPGSYEVTVTTSDGQTATETVSIGVGQTGTLDLLVGGDVVADAGATEVEELVITARQLADARTSEVATNVSRTQIDTLPQISRNFLNFAALAPGVRVTEGETERTITAGGQPATAINVFIDGQNQKSTIIDGGVAGQDDSRGNPFPQGAVQEFRVVSQNFKAEYEQAGSAIITAVTRSGSNEFEGEVFATYQNEEWIQQDYFSELRGAEQPELTREQYGFVLSGPIIEDTLHFLASYERKDETRSAQTFITRPEYADRFADQIGNFATPFEQDLFFGKLSWQINDRNRLELTGTWREEADIRDVGGQNGPERARQINTDTRSLVLRHQYQGDNFLNEMALDYFSYTYNPTSLNFDTFGQEYVIFADADGTTPGFQFNEFSREGLVFFSGGRSDDQTAEQESITFRNDLTFTNIEWNGEHTIKLGLKYSDQSYFVNKEFGRNPQFLFDIEGRPEINGSDEIPVRVTFGSDVPPADLSNTVIGLYIQDDWRITDRLELNLGLRWDYEDNAVNNDYSTPQNIRDMLAAMEALPGYSFPDYFNPDDYTTTNGRDAFAEAFQPRLGFSYDVFGDQSTVIFGGAGRYYDRIGFNFPFDERFKPTQFITEIRFSPDGSRPGTVAWDPSYLTPEGLDPLLAATPGAGEVFLIRNDAPPPRTDQFNLGVRQMWNDWQLSATLAYAFTDNEFAWYIGNPATDGNRFGGPTPSSVGFPEFRNLVFISNHDREREYAALHLQAEKPYNATDGWGFQINYTLSEATQNGSRDQGLGNFDFDYNWIDTTPTFYSPTDERHRITASGLVDLPWNFQLSGFLTLGSGRPYTIFNCPDAPAGGPNICWNEGRPEKFSFLIPDAWAYRQLDLRLTKNFDLFDGHQAQIYVDAINVFGFRNYSGFNQDFNSPEYGRPNSVSLPTRSFQIGMRYRW
ncbi:MAG: outer membrane receptor for ferrienterochelin and colicin [Brevundimonas sp.]|jgi:outer membrane receptor for ferrienterochelin and colicin